MYFANEFVYVLDLNKFKLFFAHGLWNRQLCAEHNADASNAAV